MVNAQTWLDQNYPRNRRSEVTDLYISSYNKTDQEKFTGSLTLTGFNNLTTLQCWNNKLTNLDVSSCSSLTYLHCYYNQLTSLNTSNCRSLVRINCEDNQLTTLDLSSCRNLTELSCHNNQLTSLNISNGSSLTELHCSDNKLTTLDLSSCRSLTKLYCYNNKLTTLTIFSNLVNLKTLYLDNNSWTDNNLTPLQNLTNLTDLYIRNTSIAGLEYLPANLVKIWCNGKLAEQLKDYAKKKSNGDIDYYDYQAWRKNFDDSKKKKSEKKEPEKKESKPEKPEIEKPKKITVKAQEYLANNYPQGQRKNITKLEIKETDWKSFAGELDLSDFTNLKEIAVMAEKLSRDWANFYQWLNNDIVDINAKGYKKGNIKEAKRSEYPTLAGKRDYDCLGHLMNSLERILGKTPLDYTGENSQNAHKEPVLSYDDNKTFFQLASGNSDSFKCGKTFKIPEHEDILAEYEKLLKEWKAATSDTKQVLTIKSMKNDSLPFTTKQLLTFRQARITKRTEELAHHSFTGINITKKEINKAYGSDDYTKLLANHLASNDLDNDQSFEASLHGVVTSLAAKKVMNKHSQVKANLNEDEKLAIIISLHQVIEQLERIEVKTDNSLYLKIISESINETEKLEKCKKAWEAITLMKQEAKTGAPDN